MGNKTIRMHSLLTTLKERPSTPVKELAKTFDVSEMTIRRDLAYLREHNLFDQSDFFNGGEHAERNAQPEYIFSHELIKNYEQKERIAKFAESLIEPEDVIILDNGSTTCLVPKYIPDTKNVTIICYNYQVLSQIYNRKNISIIFSGGHYHPGDMMFEAPETILLLQRTRANKLFVSASGIHETLGMTCANNYEVSTKHTVLESSYRKILLADSSKFGQIRSCYFGSLDVIDTIVTDTGISSYWQDLIQEKGIKLYIV